MEFLSSKTQRNRPTDIYDRSPLHSFMTVSNQMYITKQIYQLHRSNSGFLNYLHFKTILPEKMWKWITKFNIPRTSYNMDTLVYLNKTFIKQHSDLYEFKARDEIEVLVDTNVYKNETTIGYCDDDYDIHTTKKKYSDLMAADYGSIDVWKPISTEVTNADLRMRNQVPIWQKSMNKRHYDSANQGYHSTSERASLNTPVSGYGNDFSQLFEMKDKLYTDQTTRTRY